MLRAQPLRSRDVNVHGQRRALHLGPAAVGLDAAGGDPAAEPALRAAMSGPVASLVQALQRQMSGENEGNVFADDAKRRPVLRGVVDSSTPTCTPSAR